MRALVVPADAQQPCTVIEWQADGELLALIYGAIGCDTIDSFRIPLDGADLTVWVNDVGWYVDHPVRNARLHQVLAGLGHDRLYPVMGTVVFTEGADEEGDTQGLRESLLLDLQAAMQPATTNPTGD
jgi:hypothetical protein